MAHSRTNLIAVKQFLSICTWAVAPLSLLTSLGQAQTQTANEVSFRTLAVGKTLSDVFYDYAGAPVKVTAGSSGFSSPYKAKPGSKIEFYREIPSEKPGEAPEKLTLSTFDLGETGPYLVLVKVNPADTNEVRTKVVDASWEVHPKSNMRVFNYSLRKAMVKIGDDIAELNPTESRLFPYSKEFQVWLQAAVLENEEWTLRASAPQVLVPETRSTIMLIDQEPSEDRPVTHELLVRNFIERAPAPKK